MCRVDDVRRAVLAANDTLAAALRADLAARGTVLVSLLSSPGSGKTALLERLLRRAVERGTAVAALTADLATENDARRLARSGAPVRQVLTGGLCHLECAQLRTHLDGWLPAGTEVLFVENVGNLVCPASYDLGETLRVTLMSVTEGEDKPLKYPAAFGLANLVVLTKTDLLSAAGFDSRAFERSVAAVNPGVEILRTAVRAAPGGDAAHAGGADPQAPADGVDALLDRVLAVRAGAPAHQPVLAARHLAESGHHHEDAHDDGEPHVHDGARVHADAHARQDVHLRDGAHVHDGAHAHAGAHAHDGLHLREDGHLREGGHLREDGHLRDGARVHAGAPGSGSAQPPGPGRTAGQAAAASAAPVRPL